MRSALYVGRVRHRRHRPVAHDFTYPCVFFHLDLDELPEVASRLRLFGHNRPNLISFFDRDHADGKPGDTRTKIERLLRARGIASDGGTMFLLTQCRMFHYVFNPVSFYYVHDRNGGLRAIVAEVNNTFGERHFYVLEDSGERRVFRASAQKALHVSPFLSMDGRYEFRFMPPAERVAVSIAEHEAGERVLDAALVADRKELSDGGILWLCARYPLLTLRVIGGIHAQALRLWWKGAPFYRQPPPTAETIRQLEELRG